MYFLVVLHFWATALFGEGIEGQVRHFLTKLSPGPDPINKIPAQVLAIRWNVDQSEKLKLITKLT